MSDIYDKIAASAIQVRDVTTPFTGQRAAAEVAERINVAGDAYLTLITEEAAPPPLDAVEFAGVLAAFKQAFGRTKLTVDITDAETYRHLPPSVAAVVVMDNLIRSYHPSFDAHRTAWRQFDKAFRHLIQ